MKTLLLVALAYTELTNCSLAEPLQPLTNDVAINEQGIRFMLSSGRRADSGASAGRWLRTDQDTLWALHSSSPNISGVLFPHGHRFAFELTTTNGNPIPKTVAGKKMSEPPESLTDWRTGRAMTVWPGKTTGGELAKLTDLFNFPSNGVFMLEFRCWAWSQSKKMFVLSQPVRVKVIHQHTNAPPVALKPS